MGMGWSEAAGTAMAGQAQGQWAEDGMEQGTTQGSRVLSR